jgi:hypothetical protein
MYCGDETEILTSRDKKKTYLCAGLKQKMGWVLHETLPPGK